MEYRDHPLLEGFQDKPDSKLREVIVAQLDYSVWINDRETGMAPAVKAMLAESLKSFSRPELEKWLYHAIVQAIKSDRAARKRDSERAKPES